MIQCDDQQFIRKAQNYFQEKKWNAALKSYALVEHKNFNVLLNIGICFFNTEKYTQALINFKKAFYVLPLKDFSMLVKLEKKTYAKLDRSSPSWIDYGIKKFFIAIPLVFIQIIVLILLLLLLCFFIRHGRWSDFTKQEKLFLKKIMSILCISAMFWYVKLLYFDKYQAIVIKPQTLIYAGPEKTFHIIEKLEPADEVEISREKDGMYHIQYLKTSGWIDCDTVELINNYE
jgi:hypothetical protein